MTIFRGKLRKIPTVAIPKMFSRLYSHGSFGVYEQDKKRIGVILSRPSESVEGGIPSSTRGEGPSKPVGPGEISKRTEEVVESFPDGRFRIAPVSSTLHIDQNLPHHRLPPISPILQSSPSMYLSSQDRSLAGSRRRRCVPRSSRSQTTTDSGISERREMRVSECVVTMS